MSFDYVLLFYEFSFFFSLVGVFLSTAFFTLMERKVIGYIHYRNGPNNVFLLGVFQPFSDAMKLFLKGGFKLQGWIIFMYLLGPLLGVFFIMTIWIFIESVFFVIVNKMKVFSIFALLSVISFVFLFISWGSNSKYSIMGGYRSIAQVISYEVCLMVFLLVLFYSSKNYSVNVVTFMQNGMWFMYYSLPIFIVWVVICMAECNRPPFDLLEGESEIVSGFNIEYGGGLFSLIFIVEYSMVTFLGALSSFMFLGGGIYTLLNSIFFCFVFVWVRCSFPRIRYDELMDLCWKKFLPFSLSMLIFSLVVFYL